MSATQESVHEQSPLLSRNGESAATDSPPRSVLIRSSKVFIVFTVASAVLTDAFLYGVFVPVFPFALTNRAGVSPEDLQLWQALLLAAFGGVMLVLSPICGIYADRSSGRRIPFMLGLAINVVAVVLLAIATHPIVYFISRSAQGMASSVVWSVGLALICDSVRQDEIGVWMGWALSSVNFGVVIGPSLGGAVYERAGYVAVVAMCAGILCVDIVLRLLVIEKRQVVARYPKSAAAAKILVDTTSQPTDQRVDDQATGTDSRRRLPFMIRLLLDRRFMADSCGYTTFVVIVTAFDTVLGIHMKNKYGWNSTKAGLIYLTLGLPCLTGSLAGWVGDRLGPRYPAALGLLSAAALLVLLAFMNQPGWDEPWKIICCLTGIGFAQAFTTTPLAADMSAVVEDEQSQDASGGAGFAQAYALLNCANATGCLIGPLVSGPVIERAGWTVMNLVLAALTFSALIPVLWFTGGKPNRQ